MSIFVATHIIVHVFSVHIFPVPDTGTVQILKCTNQHIYTCCIIMAISTMCTDHAVHMHILQPADLSLSMAVDAFIVF